MDSKYRWTRKIDRRDADDRWTRAGRVDVRGEVRGDEDHVRVEDARVERALSAHSPGGPSGYEPERRENTLKCSRDFCIENGSSLGQNLVLTGLCVPSSLDSGN